MPLFPTATHNRCVGQVSDAGGPFPRPDRDRPPSAQRRRPGGWSAGPRRRPQARRRATPTRTRPTENPWRRRRCEGASKRPRRRPGHASTASHRRCRRRRRACSRDTTARRSAPADRRWAQASRRPDRPRASARRARCRRRRAGHTQRSRRARHGVNRVEAAERCLPVKRQRRRPRTGQARRPVATDPDSGRIARSRACCLRRHHQRRQHDACQQSEERAGSNGYFKTELGRLGTCLSRRKGEPIW